MSAAYAVGGQRVRLCPRHAEARRAAGQQLEVPIFDDLALIFILADRPVPEFPCTDCKEEALA